MMDLRLKRKEFIAEGERDEVRDLPEDYPTKLMKYSKPDLSIVLLGKSGVGKSATGNVILGRKVFESKLSLSPVTKDITEETGQVFEKEIRVVDTPGILDKDKEKVIKSYCGEILESNRPVLFLVVIRIGRLTNEDKKALEAVMRVLGPQGLKKSYLLFTGGDALKDMTLNEFIFENKGSLSDVMKLGEKYYLFNNEDGDQEQVRDLLVKAGHLIPDLSIVLLGKSGVGKSATGNTILRRKVFESKLSSRSVTKDITEETGQVFEKQIRVVDTPGILEKGKKKKIKSYCRKILKSNRPVLFLVVTRIGQFTSEDKEALEAVMRVLGPQGLKKSYLLFTGGDALKGTSLKDYILENKGSLPDVMKFGEKYYLFNNEDGDQEQVRDLLVKAGHLIPDVEPVIQEERRIVLLGRPRAGKSSSGNTILGSQKFITSWYFRYIRTKTICKSATVGGQQVTVVDTPGFTDEDLTDEKMCEVISRMIIEARPGRHAFVIVVRIGRVSRADIKMFEILKKLFGSDASKYIMVLFTGGDELRGQSIDEKIKDSKCLSDLVSMCGDRYCVFDNNQRGNRKQVEEFLSKIDKMVTDNGGDNKTRRSSWTEFITSVGAKVGEQFGESIVAEVLSALRGEISSAVVRQVLVAALRKLALAAGGKLGEAGGKWLVEVVKNH